MAAEHAPSKHNPDADHVQLFSGQGTTEYTRNGASWSASSFVSWSSPVSEAEARDLPRSSSPKCPSRPAEDTALLQPDIKNGFHDRTSIEIYQATEVLLNLQEDRSGNSDSTYDMDGELYTLFLDDYSNANQYTTLLSVEDVDKLMSQSEQGHEVAETDLLMSSQRHGSSQALSKPKMQGCQQKGQNAVQKRHTSRTVTRNSLPKSTGYIRLRQITDHTGKLYTWRGRNSGREDRPTENKREFLRQNKQYVSVDVLLAGAFKVGLRWNDKAKRFVGDSGMPDWDKLMVDEDVVGDMWQNHRRSEPFTGTLTKLRNCRKCGRSGYNVGSCGR